MQNAGVTPELVNLAHENDLVVFTWTVDGKDNVQKVYEAGVP